MRLARPLWPGDERLAATGAATRAAPSPDHPDSISAAATCGRYPTTAPAHAADLHPAEATHAASSDPLIRAAFRNASILHGAAAAARASSAAAATVLRANAAAGNGAALRGAVRRADGLPALPAARVADAAVLDGA